MLELAKEALDTGMSLESVLQEYELIHSEVDALIDYAQETGLNISKGDKALYDLDAFFEQYGSDDVTDWIEEDDFYDEDFNY